MGETGPCGPCSEIFCDYGPELGPDGGPANPAAEDRYVEFWNLVFMQYFRGPDGRSTDLPTPQRRHRRRPRAHPGACSQGSPSLYSRRRPVRLVDERAVGHRAHARRRRRHRHRPAAPRRPHPHDDLPRVRRRDPVQRGPRLRAAPHHPPGRPLRLPARRRAAGHCRRWSSAASRSWATPTPTSSTNRDLHRRDHRPRGGARSATPSHAARPCSTPSSTALPAGGALAGDVAFELHDTYGFPLEVTQEIAPTRGIDVDLAGFDAAMAEQRAAVARPRAGRRASPPATTSTPIQRAARPSTAPPSSPAARSSSTTATVLGGRRRRASVLDRTPFYAESGGQVGDTGTITTDTGTAGSSTPPTPCPGLHRHSRRARRGHDRAGPGGDARRSTSTAATPSGATTPAPTSCTGRCARCSATT